MRIMQQPQRRGNVTMIGLTPVQVIDSAGKVVAEATPGPGCAEGLLKVVPTLCAPDEMIEVQQNVLNNLLLHDLCRRCEIEELRGKLDALRTKAP